MRFAGIMLCGLVVTGCGSKTNPVPMATGTPAIFTPSPEVAPRARPAVDYVTGTITVSIGPGGTFSPSKVYLRPGATTIIVNRDTVPHTFVGFGGATSASGPIQPGGTFSHNWIHPGTWTFHDTLTPNAPTFTAITVPE